MIYKAKGALRKIKIKVLHIILRQFYIRIDYCCMLLTFHCAILFLPNKQNTHKKILLLICMRLTIRCEERYHRCNRGPDIIMRHIIKQALSNLALKEKVGKNL